MSPITTTTSSSKPVCEHVYLRQTTLSSTLPPLYVANPKPLPPAHSYYLATALNQDPISPSLITQLERVHSHLGPEKARFSLESRGDVTALQCELGGGMSRVRRQEMEVYVAGIRDPWKQAAAELYLARYPGFVMRGDGKLDFGTRRRKDATVTGEEAVLKWGCGVM